MKKPAPLSEGRKRAVERLRAILASERRVDPGLSVRSFARRLGISGGALSEILSEKRGLTPELAERIAPKLPLTEEERAKFIAATKRDAKKQVPRVAKPRRTGGGGGSGISTAGLNLDLPKPL